MAHNTKKPAKPVLKSSKPTPRPKVKTSVKTKIKSPSKPTPKAKAKVKVKPVAKAAIKVKPVAKATAKVKPVVKVVIKVKPVAKAPAKVKPVVKAAIKSKPATLTQSKPAVTTTAPAKAPQKSTPVSAKKSTIMEKPSKKTALRDSILKRKASSKPIAFSLDEVRAIAKTIIEKTEIEKAIKTDVKPSPAKLALAMEKAAKPSHVKAASLADILGFNPKKAKSVAAALEIEVPDKYKRYYKLLLDLRTHLTAGIELHAGETLKRSSKDDAGDLSS